MTPSILKTNLRKFMDQIWNSGNYTNVSTLVSEQYVVKHDPGDAWEGQTLNRDQFIERVMYSRNAFPDLRFDIQELIVEEQQVVAFWIMSGTHQGDLHNLPATGRAFRISGITIYSFDDEGMVCGHIQAYDRLGFVAQMGLMKA